MRSEETEELFLEMYTFTYIVSYVGERSSGGTRRLGGLRIMMQNDFEDLEDTSCAARALHSLNPHLH